MTWGDHDEALQHWRAVELPLHRRLGDARAEAITHGKIADILQARSQLDEALRIRNEEELPVYERLGDVHGKAGTMGKVADILQARSQLDEALRIRNEEELPIYERLGDVRGRAITQGMMGLQLLDEGAATDEARQLLEAAWLALSSMGLPEAEVVADAMRERGLKLPAA